MHDAETRALGRAATVLLVLSVVRWGWSRAHPVDQDLGEGPNVLSELLAESRAGEADAVNRARPLGPRERIDPNRASAADLDRLPGVGPSLAAAIVEDRKSAGPFERAEALERVRGLGEGTLARIRPHLDLSHPPPVRRSRPAPSASRAPPAGGGTMHRVAPARPPSRVDPNRADEATLQTLPGVGPVLARRIVESRRRRPFRTVEDLTRVKGIGPASLARLRDRVTLPPGG